jgi:hypothetical protein
LQLKSLKVGEMLQKVLFTASRYAAACGNSFRKRLLVFQKGGTLPPLQGSAAPKSVRQQRYENG